MKTTNLFIAVLCIAGLSAPAAAQKHNILSAAAQALTQKAPTRMLGPKRFIFPNKFHTTQGPRTLTQLNAALQRNIAQAQVVTEKKTPSPPLPTFAILSQGLPEKTFLELSAQERAFYQQETTEAFNLLSQIKALRTSPTSENSAGNDAILKRIAQTLSQIKNTISSEQVDIKGLAV